MTLIFHFYRLLRFFKNKRTIRHFKSFNISFSRDHWWLLLIAILQTLFKTSENYELGWFVYIASTYHLTGDAAAVRGAAATAGCTAATTTPALPELPPPPPPPALPAPPLRRLLSQPMCLSSPMRFTNARFASTKARCVLLPMAEWSALNQTRASAESAARRMHECTPSGEWSSRQRFSEIAKQKTC